MLVQNIRSRAPASPREQLFRTRPLHSPALAMLRWAAQLAASSLEDSPNPQELRKQLGQIRKAYSQIDRILYEGDC